MQSVFYPFEIFFYMQAGIALLSGLLFFLFFNWFGDISINYHEIFYQFMDQNARESFLSVIFFLE